MGEAGIGDQTLVRQDKKRKKEDVDSSEDSPGKPSARRRTCGRGRRTRVGWRRRRGRRGILDPRELIHVTPAIDQNLRRGDGSIHDRLPPSLSPSLSPFDQTNRTSAGQTRKEGPLTRRDRTTHQPTGCLVPARCLKGNKRHAPHSCHPPRRRLRRTTQGRAIGTPRSLTNELPLQLDPSAQFLTKV